MSKRLFKPIARATTEKLKRLDDRKFPFWVNPIILAKLHAMYFRNFKAIL